MTCVTEKAIGAKYFLTVVSLLTRIREKIGARLSTIALEARRQNAERILNRRMASFKKKDFFAEEDMSAHFADQEVSDAGLQKVLMSFIIARLNFIEKILTGDEIANDIFVDLGDSSGIFLKAFGKPGYSVNLSEEALQNIKAKGIAGIRANVGSLPLKDNSVDHVLLFETLEHVPNPVATLQEICRVCRKSLFISIPYVSQTNIREFNYDPSRPIHEHHIFEFNDTDFRKIVSHTSFKINRAEVAEVLDDGRNLKELLLFAHWHLCFEKDLLYGCFKKFSLYHLTK